MTRVQVPVPMLLDTRVLVLVSAWCLSHQHPKKTASENIDGRVYAYTWTIVNDGSVRTGALMGKIGPKRTVSTSGANPSYNVVHQIRCMRSRISVQYYQVGVNNSDQYVIQLIARKGQ